MNSFLFSPLFYRQNVLELEATRAKMDFRSLNMQLMEAIQQKIELSQQLEAWQVCTEQNVTLKTTYEYIKNKKWKTKIKNKKIKK